MEATLMDTMLAGEMSLLLLGGVVAVGMLTAIRGRRTSALEREEVLAHRQQASLVRRRQAHLASTLAPRPSRTRVALPVGPGAQGNDAVRHLR